MTSTVKVLSVGLGWDEQFSVLWQLQCTYSFSISTKVEKRSFI